MKKILGYFILLNIVPLVFCLFTLANNEPWYVGYIFGLTLMILLFVIIGLMKLAAYLIDN
jgi:hypothetical protein